MIAKQLCRNGIMIRDDIESLLGRPMTVKGDEHNYKCPFCRDAPADSDGLHVNYSKGKALCHSCGTQTSHLSNIVRSLGGTVSGAARKAPRPIPKDSEYVKRVESILFPDSPEEIDPSTLPDGFLPIPLLRGTYDVYGRAMFNYLSRRGVSKEQMDAGCFGYCDSGRYAGMIIFPVLIRGQQTYFTTRAVLGGKSQKSLNPVAARERAVFNYDRCVALNRRHIVAVEGPISATSAEHAGYGSVALLGHVMPEEMLSILSDLIDDCTEAERLTVVFDPDVSLRETMETAHKLEKYNRRQLPIHALSLRGGDPNDLDPRELRRQVDGAKRATFTEVVKARLM